jgi:L-fucose isomerase-like protein
VKVVAPNTLEKTKQACRAFALKRQLRHSKFLVYQDKPAAGGLQDEIFKRFYWWEPECTEAIEKKYGLTILKKSFKKLAEDAKSIPDETAQKAWRERKGKTPVGGITNKAILSAVKLYLKIKEDLDDHPEVIAVGMNCLNESHFCDTTPCLAWNFLYEERKMVWGCEGDTVSMLTEVLIAKTIEAPFMMTNMYPFLMGQAALKHEHIPNFPEVVGKPENHILAAHCGYLGVVPQSFSTTWTLKEKVLAIVDDNATAIDAQLPEGPVTLVKLTPPFTSWSVIEGNVPKYAQFPNSHCLNGAVIEVSDGPKMIDNIVSHHYILTTGHNKNSLEVVSKVFDLESLIN